MRITDLPSARTRTVAAVRRSVDEAQVARDWMAQDRMEAEARMLEVAELFWVTEEMAQVALDASQDLPPWSLAEIVPAQVGIIVFDGGLPELPWAVVPEDQKIVNAFGHLVDPKLPVDWFAWRCAGKSIKVEYGCHWTRTAGGEVDYSSIPLVPMGQLSISDLSEVYDLSLNFERDETDEYFDAKIAVFAMLASTWLLMSQESAASVRRTSMYASRADQRARRNPALVTTVTLRRMKSVEAEKSESGRVYHSRWVVRGHWRQQPFGPGREQSRPTWIPSYIKGPRDAPLLARERVTVWRR